MKKTFLFFVALFVSMSPLFAQIQVPVAYELTSGSRKITGNLTGGSICEPDGLSVFVENGTAPIIVPYQKIDFVENIALSPKGILSMNITMMDNTKIIGTAKISDTEPIIILQDEVASDTVAAAPRVRTFKKQDFRGINKIEFEAGGPQEISVEEFKSISEEMVKAVEERNYDKAVECHTKLADLLESVTSSDDDSGEDGPQSEK